MSDQMLAILVYCYGYQRRYGYAPTQQEIADALLRKQASIARSIQRLEHLGYVERGHGWRSLRVLRQPGERRAA